MHAVEVDHVEELSQVFRDRRPRSLQLVTTVELHRPGRALRFGAILRKELRRLQLEDAVMVEGEESLAAS